MELVDRKQQAAQRKRANWTSVEQVFKREIFLIKLAGGFLFDRVNRKLAITIKILLILAWAICDILREKSATDIVLKTLPVHRANLLQAYFFGAALVQYICLVFTTILEITNHGTVSIVIKKRFDVKYLKSLGLGHNDTPNIMHLKRMLYLWSLLCFILPSIACDGSTKLTARCIKRRLSLSNSTDLTDGCPWEMYLATEDLVNVTLITAIIFQVVIVIWVDIVLHGPSIINLMVISTISDMLLRVIEQDQLDATRRRNRGPKRGCRSNPLDARTLFGPIQTTALLVQVRDVLVCLRQTIGLNYLISICAILGQITLVPAYALILTASGYFWLSSVLIVWALLLFGFALGLISITRNLQNEAEQIEMANRKRLVEKSGQSHAQSQANVELAREIQRIWPTDWLALDVKWLLTVCVSLFAFIAGVHQVAERAARANYGAAGG